MTSDPPYFADSDAIVTAAYDGHHDNVIELIRRGANVNATDESGNTALIFASEQGLDALVDFLISSGCDLNIANNDGDTALDLAKYAKRQSTASLLVRNGAIGRDGPSAKERLEDAVYEAFEHANRIKSGQLSGHGSGP